MISNPSSPDVFTVGHSTLDITVFLSLLKQHGIEVVADVRSSPYSRHNPQFNREILKESLLAIGIQYVFLGDQLGARRSELECYADGQARYEKIAQTPAFQQGLQRLGQGIARKRVALLCTEKDPLECHRAILICRHLKKTIPSIWHILSDGSLESHEQTENRLLRQLKLEGEDLFLSKAEILDDAYERQGKRIAYKEENVLQ